MKSCSVQMNIIYVSESANKLLLLLLLLMIFRLLTRLNKTVLVHLNKDLCKKV